MCEDKGCGISEDGSMCDCSQQVMQDPVSTRHVDEMDEAYHERMRGHCVGLIPEAELASARAVQCWESADEWAYTNVDDKCAADAGGLVHSCAPTQPLFFQILHTILTSVLAPLAQC